MGTPHIAPSMGAGAAAAIGTARSGTVIAAFDKAVYLRFPGGIVALTAPSVPRGPVHVHSPIDLTRLAGGAPFLTPAGWPDQATIWRGEVPAPTAITAETVQPLAILAQRSALLSEPLVRRWEAAAGQDDLAEVCRILGGLGPGLTPSGDDALAGLFLAAYIRRPADEGRLVALAERVATHEISRAFLAWAARGQSIEPIHRLLAGDPAGAADLGGFGHSSGADLALGLRHGLRQHATATAATGPWPGRIGFAPPGGC